MPRNTIPNPREEIKAISTQSGNVLAEPSVPIHPLFSSSKEVERDPETITDQVLHESTTRVPPLVVQPSPSSRPFEIPLSSTPSCSELPKRNPYQPQIPYPSTLNKEKLQDKSDIQELEKYMALANLGASINLMPLFVWKKLMLPELVPTRMTLELANRSLAYPASIAEDVFVQVGRPFLRTARALVDVYIEELILRDGDEKSIFHADSTSKHPQKHRNESMSMINFIDITYEDHFEEVLKIKKSNHWISGITTSLSDSSPSLVPFKTCDSLLEKFADELSLLDPFPPGNEDDNFDPEADLREIEYLLNRDPSTDFSPIIDPNLERFTNEPAPLLYGDNYNDTHSENDKTKDSNTKSLIDELEYSESSVLLPQLLDYDSTFHEELHEIDTLTSFPSENKDKVFNPGILVHGSTYFVTNLVTQDKTFKKKTSSEASLILEERSIMSIPSDRELPFHYELPETQTLLSFSSENEDKVFNPGILISKGVHSLTLGLSHQNYGAFKIISIYPNILNGSPMKIFPFFCFCPKDKGIQGEYKGLKTKQKRGAYMPRGTTQVVTRGTTNDWVSDLQVRGTGHLRLQVQRIENEAKMASGTQSADVAVPRRLIWDPHADVAPDMVRGTVHPRLQVWVRGSSLVGGSAGNDSLSLCCTRKRDPDAIIA
ncbi:hypothetical protein Tco_0666694 [Tanacetum coccineum]